MSTPVTTSLPLPGTGSHVVAAAAPAPGPQNWAGAPSAVLDDDGSIVVGYRLRHAGELRDEVVIARSEDVARVGWRRDARHEALAHRDARGADPRGPRRRAPDDRVRRRSADDRREGPGDPPHGERLARVAVRPPPRGARPGGPHVPDLRDEPRRPALEPPRHRAARALRR